MCRFTLIPRRPAALAGGLFKFCRMICEVRLRVFHLFLRLETSLLLFFFTQSTVDDDEDYDPTVAHSTNHQDGAEISNKSSEP